MPIECEQTSIDGFIQLATAMLQELQGCSSIENVAANFPATISEVFAAQVIRASFFASMTSEEGKWPRVTLQACRRDTTSERIATFDPPVVFDASSIAKLAHSVEDWCSLGFTELNGVPVIVDILPSVSVLLGTFVTQRALSMSSFKVAIRCPGHIDVICERGILSFKAGYVTKYQSILASKALERLSGIMDLQVNLLQDQGNGIEPSANKESQSKKTDLLTYPDSKAQLVISELVWRISEIGSGGILIVTTQPAHNTLNYKYRTDAGCLQNAVVKYWQAAQAWRSAPTSNASSPPPSSELIHEGVKLRECVAATAQLAGTDGAIVLGTSFGLHGFGAHIGNIAVDESGVRFIDGSDNPIRYSNIVRNKGSRHQAALSFAMREEGVVLFVVSQDGHVTVLENQGGVVRVETGLRADGV